MNRLGCARQVQPLSIAGQRARLRNSEAETEFKKEEGGEEEAEEEEEEENKGVVCFCNPTTWRMKWEECPRSIY